MVDGAATATAALAADVAAAVGWRWWEVLGAGLACGALLAVVGTLLIFRLLARALQPPPPPPPPANKPPTSSTAKSST